MRCLIVQRSEIVVHAFWRSLHILCPSMHETWGVSSEWGSVTSSPQNKVSVLPRRCAVLSRWNSQMEPLSRSRRGARGCVLISTVLRANSLLLGVSGKGNNCEEALVCFYLIPSLDPCCFFLWYDQRGTSFALNILDHSELSYKPAESDESWQVHCLIHSWFLACNLTRFTGKKVLFPHPIKKALGEAFAPKEFSLFDLWWLASPCLQLTR